MSRNKGSGGIHFVHLVTERPPDALNQRLSRNLLTFRPTSGRGECSREEYGGKYISIDENRAKVLWNQQYQHTVQHHHILTGGVLAAAAIIVKEFGTNRDEGAVKIQASRNLHTLKYLYLVTFKITHPYLMTHPYIMTYPF